MDSSFWFDTLNLEWSIVYILGCQVITKKNFVFFLSEDVFIFTNSVDTDEMPHDASFRPIWVQTVCKGYQQQMLVYK